MNILDKAVCSSTRCFTSFLTNAFLVKEFESKMVLASKRYLSYVFIKLKKKIKFSHLVDEFLRRTSIGISPENAEKVLYANLKDGYKVL